MKHKNFDYTAFEKEALEKLQNGEPLSGKDGVLTPLIKRIVEASLEGEIESFMEENPTKKNRRNGRTTKPVKTSHGTVEIATPRDREGDFTPQLIGKRQTTLGEGLDEKILSLYGLGMSYIDIRAHLEDLYGLEVSSGTLSAITDKIIPELQEWQTRPLDAVYPFVFMDAIHYKVRTDGLITIRAVYCLLGIDTDGKKEILGMYLGENEGAKFWLQILTDLQTRGVKDILIACIDGLKGFSQAIESVFPKTEVQLCVIHQIRHSIKYIVTKDIKEFLHDLKKVYRAINEQKASIHLEELKVRWGEKYPAVIKSWENNWDKLSNYFQYSPQIRKMIYTTNAIEGFHRGLRKRTKTKGAFSSEMALMKILYLAQIDITKKWRDKIYNWNLVVQQLSIKFGDRLKLDLPT